jgi:hypothetical protein
MSDMPEEWGEPYVLPPEGNVYRVSFSNDTKNVFITCLGIKCLDTSVRPHYVSIRDTPKWVQEGVALLMMTDRIEGIGERHYKHRNVFYLYHD